MLQKKKLLIANTISGAYGHVLLVNRFIALFTNGHLFLID